MAYAKEKPTMVPSRERIVGYDVARGLAVMGMVLVNFKIVMGAGEAGSEWLVWLASLFDGRAAATFVVLAGVGLSLISQSARISDDVALLAKNRRMVFKRSLFLFVVGLMYVPIWPADILHFYGVYIAIGAVLLRVSDRSLWGLMIGLMVSFPVFMLVFDYEVGWDWSTLTYHGFWTVDGMIRHLFFNGFHPVIPWVAFLLLGMWLGRQDLSDVRRRRAILWGAGGIVCVTELVSRALIAWVIDGDYALSAEDIQALLGTGPMPPLPFYLMAGGGTAVVVIVLCVIASERWAGALWIVPLASTGQLALTLYVAHVVVGMTVLDGMGRLEDQSLVFACVSALAFCVVGVIFSSLWHKRFGRGPLEWMMRRITG